MNHREQKEPFIECDDCGHVTARVHKAARTYNVDGELLVIREVRVVSCTYCGESYLTADTMQKLEQIKRNRKSLAVEEAVEVAAFN